MKGVDQSRAAELGFRAKFKTPLAVYTTLAERRGLYKDEIPTFIDENPLYMQALQRHVSSELQGVRTEHFEAEVRRQVIVTVKARALAEQAWRLMNHIAPALSFEDSLTVDDYFLQIIEPPCLLWATRLRELYSRAAARDRVPWRAARLLPDEARKATEIKKHFEEAWPLADWSSYLDDHARPICWHPGGHTAWRKAGRTTDPSNRFRVWATYLLAWLTGSGTVAVRWFNLLCGPQWSWGHVDGSKPRYAHKLYVEARDRLVADIEEIQTHGPIDTIYRSSEPWGTPSDDIIAFSEEFLRRAAGRS